jgi:hypothetical protein
VARLQAHNEEVLRELRLSEEAILQIVQTQRHEFANSSEVRWGSRSAEPAPLNARQINPRKLTNFVQVHADSGARTRADARSHAHTAGSGGGTWRRSAPAIRVPFDLER